MLGRQLLYEENQSIKRKKSEKGSKEAIFRANGPSSINKNMPSNKERKQGKILGTNI